MFVVDTNIWIHAANHDSALHRPCRELVEQWRQETGAWYSTWNILYEFMRVVTHPRVLRNPWKIGSTRDYIESLRAAPGFGLLTETDRHAEALDDVLKAVPEIAGNFVHDAHTAVLMHEHGIRTIYTLDTKFHRFGFLEVVDPLTQAHDGRLRSRPRRAPSGRSRPVSRVRS